MGFNSLFHFNLEKLLKMMMVLMKNEKKQLKIMMVLIKEGMEVIIGECDNKYYDWLFSSISSWLLS
jgi:hypothetical protein